MLRWLMMSLLLVAACGCGVTAREVWQSVILPEARTIDYRDPLELPAVPIPASAAPKTVSNLRPELTDWHLSLDEAIRIALERTRTVRVLAGTTATASGQTIYDAAITNTTIDQAQARFDPTLTQNNQWSRTNTPTATTNLADFTRSVITNNATDAYLSTLGLTQTNVLGGQAGLTWMTNPVRFPGGGSGGNPFFPGFGLPLNPQTSSSLALSYTQPLLQGAGFRVNPAPIVIARLNTELS